MSAENESTETTETIGQGTYEILRDRLREQARTLRQRADQLNARRLEIFGGAEMTVLGNERIRTENNCVPRDVVPAGRYLLFGYNVFIGLKTEVRVEDVFSLHAFEQTDQGFEFATLPAEAPENFLSAAEFVTDFKELYQYYKNARLLQLRNTGTKILAVFQIGAELDDVRVLRWAIDPDGRVTYIDNRGERDHVFPLSHDFEWTATGRKNFVFGRHPHVSILDEVFVETVGGDLTVKVEDNTEDGFGIYREPVDEPDQSLDDGQIDYAKLGTLILLKVLPYGETKWRYLVFNTRNQQVDRIDAIGQACVQLPADHGLIFPGGYYLRSGETKLFEGEIADMEFQRMMRSPNGEDVLYIFHRRDEGRSILLPYNMIRKEVQNPIHCHGFSFFADGRLVIFRSTSDEPTRVHPMQIWQTPFMSEEHAAAAPSTGSYLERVGNSDLVQGISEALSICRMVDAQEPTLQIYEDLIAATVRVADAFYWLDHPEVGDLLTPLKQVRATGELIVDEFEKVQTIRRQAEEAVSAADRALDEVGNRLRGTEMTSVDRFVGGLAELRNQRGHLISLKEMRYADLDRIDRLEARIVEQFDELSGRAVEFLSDEAALGPYHARIDELVARGEAIEKTTEARELGHSLGEIGDGMELLTEVIGSLKIDDPTVRTRILEGISEVLSSLNRARAVLEARRKELLSAEGVAEFGAQFKLFSQSVSGALGLADTPEKCDEQLAKLMLQLEELEGRFGEFDQFVEPLATKREDVYEAFSSKKQSLVDARQRRALRMMQAAERILEGIARRASSLQSVDELNTYFVGDAMVAKVRDLSGQLREIGDVVKADELDSRLKSAKEDAARGLRDRQDIFEEGTRVIKLGRHRFSVNEQPFDLTMVPYRDGMAFHLTGTDFHEAVADEEFEATREYWEQLVVSETKEVYRGEYLAAAILLAAEEETGGLRLSTLHEAAAAGEGGLLEVVRKYAAERYEEGYERGLHDHDAALILEKLLALYGTADLLRYAPRPRAWACLFWAFYGEQMRRALWERRAHSLARLRSAFAHSPAISGLQDELGEAIGEFFAEHRLEVHPDDARMAGAYLFEELAKHPLRFTTSAEAVRLPNAFQKHLRDAGTQRDFTSDLEELQDDFTNRYQIAHAWVSGFLDQSADEEIRKLAPSREETVVLLLTERRLDRTESSALASMTVEGLLGQHPRIASRRMELRLDEFLSRLTAFRQHRVPGFHHYQEMRHRLLERERKRLRLGEYMPKVMSAFVRNRLINEVYLPLIGDNLAKQLGALGAGKRTDQMGLLLLISPPGYGKTTLMEYVANRLGLVFVKANGPALGHTVTSLDATEAPNATARQEVEKINFSLEMANNVLLYLDDIQHTNSELLQKFISLCDAQRRIEGVWQGETQTYDLRGKRFAICMAGNPYTESGEKFQIPDMLANRADTYNLGDILEGKDEVFALSYLENALTSNPVLAPLTTREPGDVFKLVRMAQGEEMTPDELTHPYSSVELEEILSVLRKLLRVQQVLLTVNQQYIYSASQDDAFRTEPRFQLQGSYRNMNKLAEKIVPVMNEEELEALIEDHYVGEAQTLTTGAEHNMLKLAELRQVMSDQQRARWEEIKRGFARVQAMGGAEDDPAVRVIGQLGLVSDRLHDIGKTIESARAAAPQAGLGEALAPFVESLQGNLGALSQLASRAPAGGDGLGAQVEALSQGLTSVVDRLAELTQVVSAQMATSAPAGPALDLTPYLAKLDQTMTALAEAPRGGEVVQTLDPGVYELLARLATAVDNSLMPLVKGLGQQIKVTEAAGDRQLTNLVDRTLKSLDQMKDLVAALRKIDTRGIRVQAAEE